jgi:hypothetical protein
MAARERNCVYIGLACAFLMLVMGPAASAFASAQVRLINARSGSGVTLTVTVGGTKAPTAGTVAFGDAGQLVGVPAGDAELAVGGKTVKKPLADGASYDVVALPKSAVEVLRNGSAAAQRSRLRVVHAAPELGTPDIRLGKRTIAQGVKFRSATGYLTVDPGEYAFEVTKPNGGAAVFKSRVALAAGTATTVVVAGSAGSATRMITVNDGTVTPPGAPHTGLGGLARGGSDPWVLALLAALFAGSLGGAVQLTRARRSRS